MGTKGSSFRRLCLAMGTWVAFASCGNQSGSGQVSPAACGQPEDGTRLKAFYLDADDGAREYFDLWTDTELGTACRFQVTRDGRTRCLPFDRSFASSFLDDACTTGIVDDYAPACLRRARGVPKYAIQIEILDECSETFRLFSLGAGSIPASIHVRSPDGVCSPPQPNIDGRIFYPLGAEVPLASLVAADVQTQGARLQTRYATGEDGSRGRVHRFVDLANVFDSQQGVDCDMQVAADGLLRCLPASSRNVLRSGVFADARCSERVAVDDRFACEKAMVATPRWTSLLEFVPSTNACPQPSQVRVHRLGATSVPATTYLPGPDATAGACLGVPNTDGASVYALGEEAPASTFVPVTLREHVCGPHRSSGTRLKVKQQTSDDGLRIERGSWTDTKLGVTCVFRTAADGRLRCLPDTPASFGADFSDPACAHLIASAEPCAAEDPDPTPPQFAIRARDPAEAEVDICIFDGDDRRAHVHRLGPSAVLDTVYHRGSDGSCVATPVSAFFFNQRTQRPATSPDPPPQPSRG